MENKLEVLKEINIKIRQLENEIEGSQDYIKLIKNKIKTLAKEKDDIIDGRGSFDQDQLRLFDLDLIKEEFNAAPVIEPQPEGDPEEDHDPGEEQDITEEEDINDLFDEDEPDGDPA